MKSLEYIERIRRQEASREAQEELYNSVRDVLLDRLRFKIPKRLQSRLDPEDVLHTAFLKAIEALDTFHASDDRYFFAWVYTIAKNLIHDAAKRHSVRLKHLARGEESPGPRESQIVGPAIKTTRMIARREWIETMLGQLKEKEADVIRMRQLSGMSFEMIASKWQKSPAAVQRFYSRAWKRLQEVARRHGEALD